MNLAHIKLIHLVNFIDHEEKIFIVSGVLLCIVEMIEKVCLFVFFENFWNFYFKLSFNPCSSYVLK